MSEFLEKYRIAHALSASLGAVKTVWQWTQARLWPVFSAAIVISIFQMIAISSEKQIMADHYFGEAESTSDGKREELVADAKKLFNEEVGLAVKERVWQLPPAAFKREYNSRHGSA